MNNQQLSAELSRLQEENLHLAKQNAELWRTNAELWKDKATRKLDARLETSAQQPTSKGKLLDAYTAQELADELNRSYSTLAGWRTEGIGPKPTIIMGRVYYMRSDVEAWLNSGDAS